MSAHRSRPFYLSLCAVVVTIAAAAVAQTGAETFSATATLKTAAGTSVTAPITIDVTRKMSQQEADKFTSAFTTGGAVALRKALTGQAPTGSVHLGSGKPTPTRLTLERSTDKGRMLTIVTDQPLMFLGGGLPQAKPKQGFDFGIVDFVIDDNGIGVGTMSPAAKVTVREGAFVVDEYSGELIRLSDVKKVR
jgi:hypothetical protein